MKYTYRQTLGFTQHIPERKANWLNLAMNTLDQHSCAGNMLICYYKFNPQQYHLNFKDLCSVELDCMVLKTFDGEILLFCDC